MNSYVIKGRGKIRIVHLTPLRKGRRQRIKRVEIITQKGMAPKRYPLGCHGALTEWCLTCYTGRENRPLSAKQALEALFQSGRSINTGG